MLILLVFAFISGLLTILAPCIWPLLPIVLSATSTGGRSKPLGITLGILISFTIFTLSLSYLVAMFHFDPNTLRLMAVIVLTILGLSLIVKRLSALIEVGVSRLSNVFGGKATERKGFFGGLITGLSLGIVWAPCAGPILASIAALAATQMVSSRVVLVTLGYMAGTGIPLFIFATVGQNLLTRTRTLSPYLGRIQQFFGVVIIVTAIGIWTNYDKVIQARLLDAFPGYSNFLFRLEQNKKVREQLDVLRGRQTRETETKSFLPDLGPAADFMGVDRWLNSPPLTLAELRGKVVLVDFWTYTCINCVRTLPFVTGWYEKYKSAGFVVVGVHTPEFEFEKKTENVAMAVKMYEIKYPVAQDNAYATWNNYENLYWPAKYLIDKNGHLRLTHFGEGAYQEIEQAIQALLAETGKPVAGGTLSLPEETPVGRLTAETYLGLARLTRMANRETPREGTANYKLNPNPNRDSFSFGGSWTLTAESAESQTGSKLNLKFFAKKVFLVMTPGRAGEVVRISLDGKLKGELRLTEPKLYELIALPEAGEHLLLLEFGGQTKTFAFTFG